MIDPAQLRSISKICCGCFGPVLVCTFSLFSFEVHCILANCSLENRSQTRCLANQYQKRPIWHLCALFIKTSIVSKEKLFIVFVSLLLDYRSVKQCTLNTWYSKGLDQTPGTFFVFLGIMEYDVCDILIATNSSEIAMKHKQKSSNCTHWNIFVAKTFSDLVDTFYIYRIQRIVLKMVNVILQLDVTLRVRPEIWVECLKHIRK